MTKRLGSAIQVWPYPANEERAIELAFELYLRYRRKGVNAFDIADRTISGGLYSLGVA
jgi:hypothetical protein